MSDIPPSPQASSPRSHPVLSTFGIDSATNLSEGADGDISHVPLSSNAIEHGDATDYDNAGQPQSDRTNAPDPYCLEARPHGTDNTRGDDENLEKAKQARNGSEIWRIWWLEIGSCILFIGALVAIVLTIRPFEGEALPQWPYSITINTLLSIYAVILKAAVLLVLAEGLSQLKWRWFDRTHPLKDLLCYDEASRGPWGCLTLLYRLRGRQFVASCGASISLAALIVDPFAQQVIATYGCVIPTEAENATIPRTNSFGQNFRDLSDVQDVVSAWGLQYMEPAMLGSIQSGVFGPIQGVEFDCPTGNCTFPSRYHTVGFCSKCFDRTSRLSVETTRDEAVVLHLPTFGTTYKPGLTAKISPQVIYDRGEQFLVMHTFGGRTFSIMSNLDGKEGPLCPGACSALGYLSESDCASTKAEVSWGCRVFKNDQTFGAAECRLEPCVRSYRASVEDGKLQETLLSTSEISYLTRGTPLRLNGSASLVDVKCVDEEGRASLSAAGYDIGSQTWLPYNFSIDPASLKHFDNKAGTPSSHLPGAVLPRCIYQLGYYEYSELVNSIDSFFHGEIMHFSSNVGTSNSTQTLSDLQQQWSDGKAGFIWWGPHQLRAIWNQGRETSLERLEKIWANVSESATTYMRQHGTANLSIPATGIANAAQTCVHIRWWFLAYPVIVVILAIAFFVAMIYQTRSRGSSRHDWKSSALALVFHGLERQSIAREELLAATTASDMAKIAEHARVRLNRGSEGWQFFRDR